MAGFRGILSASAMAAAAPAWGLSWLGPDGIPVGGLLAWEPVAFWAWIIGALGGLVSVVVAEQLSGRLRLLDGSERSGRVNAYLASRRRSPIAALVLAALFGPLGYLYASPGGAAFYLALGVLAWVFLSWVAVPAWLLLWLLSMVVAPISAHDYNKRLMAEAELMAGPGQAGQSSVSTVDSSWGG